LRLVSENSESPISARFHRIKNPPICTSYASSGTNTPTLSDSTSGIATVDHRRATSSPNATSSVSATMPRLNRLTSENS